MIRSALLLTGILFLFGCNKGQLITDAIDEVRVEVAPDKRVALFEVEISDRNPLVLKGQTDQSVGKDLLFRQLDSLGLNYVDSIRLLPDPSLEANWGIVQLSVCNIRSNPKHSAELSTQCTMGQVIRVLEEAYGWYRIQTPDGYLGWLDPGGFRFLQDSVIQSFQSMEKVVFLPEFGFAYSGADHSAPPASDLLRGNILFRKEKGNLFDQVVLPSGDTAFVPSDQLRNADNWWTELQGSRSPESLIREAEQMIGRPYLWGGTSGKGMDCSGFTKEVFFRNGVILPRDASQQVHVGLEIPTDTISWSGLQTGDLLFFGRRAGPETTERITHVAIYMGEGKIIHSSGSVCIESLIQGQPGYVPERVASFVRAKRLLPQAPPENRFFVPPL